MQPVIPAFALLVPLFLTIIFLLFGGAMLFFSISAQRKAQATMNWTETTGQVLSAHMERHLSHSRRRTRRTYEPVIVYEYRVMGSPYQGRRVNFGTTRYGRTRAEAVLAQFPEGSTVPVFYDPQNPTEAVLQREAKGATVLIVMGAVFLLIGFMALCMTAAFVPLVLSAG